MRDALESPTVPTAEQELGQAIQRELESSGRSQSWLGGEVARIEGRDEPYSQSAVSYWLSAKYVPSPTQVFAIEEALSLRPGTLSRIVGYLPASSRSVRSVGDAIDTDPRLTANGRRIVRAVYQELVASSD